MRLKKVLLTFLPGLLLSPFLLLLFTLELPVVSPVVASAEPPSPLLVSDLKRVAKLTGKDSLNATDLKYGIFGTDLGIMWDSGNGQLLMAFGDTYGQGWGGCGSGPALADWRSNTLARSSDFFPQDGLTFSGMIEDTPGHAKELLNSRKIDYLENTIIPTAGISVGTRNYLHFMSVRSWGEPGMWHTNYAGLAYSDDYGQNWTVSPGAMWPNSKWNWGDKFQQAAFAREGGYVYIFGTPNGRFGNAYLARVPEQALLNKSRYEYWDGRGWQLNDELAATPIVSGPVGEMSVQYNQHFGRWLMTYMDEKQQAIVLRDAPGLTGPWSRPQTLVSATAYPQLYGAFIHPWFNDGTDLYFSMSQWCAREIPYNVSFMHARLSLNPNVRLPSSIEQSGFPGKAWQRRLK